MLFRSKILETAKALGITVINFDPHRGVSAIAEAHPSGILLDLNSRTLPPLEWICTFKTDPATRPIRIVGFASHIQENLIAAARAAGCDVVMARSTFSQRLPEILRSLANEDAADSVGE